MVRPAASLARRRPPRPATPLPAYALYGEPHARGLDDLLHVESIALRSRAHGWEIAAHRHEALFQFLVIREGTLQAWLDGRTLALRGPCAIGVPALTAHGFRFAPEVDGSVFTIVESHLRAMLQGDAVWRDAVLRLQVLPGLPAAALQASARLAAEYAQRGPWRAQAVDAALRLMLLELARAAPPLDEAAPAVPAPRAMGHVRRLRELVDAQYRRQPSLTALAAQIGITPTQLNRACRQVLGHSALGVLHQRLVLEARRELAYTAMSVKEVASDLGFSDAGYFTRFFQRLTGQTPSAWRQAALR